MKLNDVGEWAGRWYLGEELVTYIHRVPGRSQSVSLELWKREDDAAL